MPARKHAKAGLGAIAAAMVAVAVIGGLATDTTSDWYRSLDRPSWQPQGWVFSSVWTVLYILIGFAWFRAWGWLEGPRRRPVLWLFATNAVLNVGWTWIFFQAEAPEAAGVEIVALLAAIVTLIALTGARFDRRRWRSSRTPHGWRSRRRSRGGSL